jgi:hypothetical protein
LEGSSVASREVTVRFFVQVGSADFAPEPVPGDRPLPARSYRRVRGAIEIVSDDRPAAMAEDELVPLVSNLCFSAVSTVLSQRHAVVAFTDTYGYLRLDLEGARIRLSGDDLPDMHLAAASLLDGLIACGARFRVWLRGCKLEGDVDAIDRQLGTLEANAREAMKAAVWA